MQISGVLLNPKERVGMSQISWSFVKMSSFVDNTTKESDPFVSLTGKKECSKTSAGKFMICL